LEGLRLQNLDTSRGRDPQQSFILSGEWQPAPHRQL
jgi:hypothetical protein